MVSYSMSGPNKASNKRCMIAVAIGCILFFVIGILIGRFATCPDDESEDIPRGVYLPGVSERIMQDGDPGIGAELMNNIKTENIRQYLRYIA